MAKSTKARIDVQEVEIDESAVIVEKAKGFWGRFGKMITYGGGAIIILLAAYIAYDKFYQEPREKKANEAIWKAQQYFAQDSMRLALEGDGQFSGFEKIAKNYGGTKAGNLAQFYAGVAALQLGDYNKSVKYLEGFSTSAKEIQAVAYARLADAYSELNKDADAIKYYEKAGTYFPEQEALSAENLFRAGLKSEVLGKQDDALKYYRIIKEKYPRTERGFQIDKYLARLGEVK